MLSEPLSSSLVRRALAGGREPASAEDQPTLEAIQGAVSEATGVGREQLVSALRTPRVAHARQLAMYLSRELTSASLARIAGAFERDHTTVLHAVKVVQSRLEPGSETLDAVHRSRVLLGMSPGGRDHVHHEGDRPQPSSTPG
jgi:chromosomal replication initiator protein